MSENSELESIDIDLLQLVDELGDKRGVFAKMLMSWNHAQVI